MITKNPAKLRIAIDNGEYLVTLPDGNLWPVGSVVDTAPAEAARRAADAVRFFLANSQRPILSGTRTILGRPYIIAPRAAHQVTPTIVLGKFTGNL